jgi:cytochrome c oxidase assembly protein subunit 15
VLNPWVVASHFLLSMAMIAAAYRLRVVARDPDDPAQLGDPALPAGPPPAMSMPAVSMPAVSMPAVPKPLRALGWLVTGVSGAVLAVGTVVTGSGPHAGDASARRTGLYPGMVAQVHADLVMLLVGLSVGLWYALRTVGARDPARRAAAVLVGVELAQGLVGFAQYFTHVPALLVGLHMAGACAVWLATLAALASVLTGSGPVRTSRATRGDPRVAADNDDAMALAGVTAQQR